MRAIMAILLVVLYLVISGCSSILGNALYEHTEHYDCLKRCKERYGFMQARCVEDCNEKYGKPPNAVADQIEAGTLFR